jgi:hypothetical protein
MVSCLTQEPSQQAKKPVQQPSAANENGGNDEEMKDETVK